MALKTLGTAATTTLSALLFGSSSGYMTDSDLALMNAAIKADVGVMKDTTLGGTLGPYVTREGQLWVPRRGFLKVLKGDYIAIDPATGWPILIAGAAAAGASYVHT